jgi:hypothetical protein
MASETGAMGMPDFVEDELGLQWLALKYPVRPT